MLSEAVFSHGRDAKSVVSAILFWTHRERNAARCCVYCERRRFQWLRVLLHLQDARPQEPLRGKPWARKCTFTSATASIDENGTISVVMPNGEFYKGRFILGKASSLGIGFVPGRGAPLVFSSGSNTSNAAAVLMGNRGDSMHREFKLAHASDDLEGGGIGWCQVSTGQVINATF